MFSAGLPHIFCLRLTGYYNPSPFTCIFLIEALCSSKRGTHYSIFQIVTYDLLCTLSCSIIKVNEENSFKVVSINYISTMYIIIIHVVKM